MSAYRLAKKELKLSAQFQLALAQTMQSALQQLATATALRKAQEQYFHTSHQLWNSCKFSSLRVQ